MPAGCIEVIFAKMLIFTFCSFLIRLIGFCCWTSFFYILDISPLSDIRFAAVFSYSVRLFFPVFELFLLLCRNFWVWCSSICWFLLLLFVLLVSYPKLITKTNVKELVSWTFFQEFYGDRSSRQFLWAGEERSNGIVLLYVFTQVS